LCRTPLPQIELGGMYRSLERSSWQLHCTVSSASLNDGPIPKANSMTASAYRPTETLSTMRGTRSGPTKPKSKCCWEAVSALPSCLLFRPTHKPQARARIRCRSRDRYHASSLPCEREIDTGINTRKYDIDIGSTNLPGAPPGTCEVGITVSRATALTAVAHARPRKNKQDMISFVPSLELENVSQPNMFLPDHEIVKPLILTMCMLA
jgi:hypothetical protein